MVFFCPSSPSRIELPAEWAFYALSGKKNFESAEDEADCKAALRELNQFRFLRDDEMDVNVRSFKGETRDFVTILASKEAA